MAVDQREINPDGGPPLAIRLLDDAATLGPVNMARDEALLEAVGSGDSPPTLRFYGWSLPTISLGYFQHFTDYESLPAPAGALPVVRRLTGGGAILHDCELTYALVLPTQHRIARRKPNALYELVHDALIACLAEGGVTTHRDGADDGSGAAKGPFFCFARRHRYDVLIGTDKVAGSAQRRSRDAVLQHGSIVLQRRFDQQPAAELRAFGVEAAALRRGLAIAIAAQLEATVCEGVWTDRERERADAFEPKYSGDEWTRRK